MTYHYLGKTENEYFSLEFIDFFIWGGEEGKLFIIVKVEGIHVKDTSNFLKLSYD